VGEVDEPPPQAASANRTAGRTPAASKIALGLSMLPCY